MVKRVTNKWFLGSIALLLLLLFITIQKIDETSYTSKEYYPKTLSALDSAFKISSVQTGEVSAGWAKANITPLAPTRIVGFGIQEKFETVNDSVFVRAFVFQQNNKSYAMLSYDLLFVHPHLRNAVEKQLKQEGIAMEGMYYTATHSHNSFGGWGFNRLVDDLVVAGEDKAIMDQVVTQTVNAIKAAIQNTSTTEIGYGKFDFNKYIRNRITEEGELDPWMHVLKLVHTQNGDTALITTFSAHATCLFGVMDENILSGDYPSIVSSSLENQGYAISMFCTGGVASFSPRHETSNIKGMMNYSKAVADSLKSVISSIKVAPVNELEFLKFPVYLDEPTFRISEYYQLKPYLFNKIMGEIEAGITVFKLGEHCFLGMPGEISGELYQEEIEQAAQKNINLMVTSLNGDYIGYVVPGHYYHSVSCKEVREMNWFGSSSGEYFEELLNRVLDHL